MIHNIVSKNIKIKRYKNFPPKYCKIMRNKNIYCSVYFIINKLTNEIFYVGITKRYLNIIINQLRHNAFDINHSAFNSKLYNYIRLLNLNNGRGYHNIEIYELEYFEQINNTELLF